MNTDHQDDCDDQGNGECNDDALDQLINKDEDEYHGLHDDAEEDNLAKMLLMDW